MSAPERIVMDSGYVMQGDVAVYEEWAQPTEYVRALDPCDPMQDARVLKLIALLRRYRHETPLGHQPHMIASEVDAALAVLEKEQDT